MKGLDFSKLAKTNASFADMNVTYHIPIVFHVVHDYGVEYVTDNKIYEVVEEMNRFYNRQNADTSDIIATYAGKIPGTNIKYAGKTNIKFHLANRDPQGQPSHGITRRRSYLTAYGGDQAKMDLWPPDQYINIWVIRVFDVQHDGAAAYAYKPVTANNIPYVYWDGVISLSSYIDRDNTISHEVGHTLSLDHPWGGTNSPEVACGDDGVDDTPPTIGHMSNGCGDLTKIFDSKCVLTPFTLGNSSNINLAKATNFGQENLGIKFSTKSRIYLDSVNFFTQDSAANYTLRVRYNGNQVASYSSQTNYQTPVYQNVAIGKPNIDHLYSTPDQGTTDGLLVRNPYKVILDSVSFFTGDSTTRPYAISVINNGNTVYTYNGNTTNNRIVNVGAAIGKDTLNPATAVSSTSTSAGISFKNRQAIYFDSVTVYPSAPVGSTFQITIKNSANVVVATSPVFTTTTNTGKQTVALDMAVMDVDSVNGFTMEFLQNPGMKSDVISGSIASKAGMLMEITNATNGSQYNFFYNLRVSFKNYLQRVPLRFATPSIDTVNGYLIRFASNPGAKRDSIGNTNYALAVPNKVNIVNDGTNGSYNYFYNLSVKLYSFRQRAETKFVINTADTTANSYELSFAPGGATVETDSTVLGYLKTTPGDTLRFTKDTTQGRYGGIYGWDFRYGNYFKIYDPATAEKYFGIISTTPVYIDYPDTVNSQNVMDYTYCSKMFTHLQGLRMRTALEDPTAGRNNLIQDQNLKNTGVMDANGNFIPRQDLPIIPDFSLPNNQVFVCANSVGGISTPAVTFTNRSWNDTISGASWTFTNGATSPTSTSTVTVTNQRFTQPGWVTVTLDATSNVNGTPQTNSITKSRSLYVADPNAISPNGYYQEFAPGGDLDKYPIFNHFENSFKWEVINNTGYYDNYSIRYNNFDNRTTFPAALTGYPRGDFDDFYTPAFNVAGIGSGNAYLNFYSAGAFRTNVTSEMLDTLEIAYTTNCGGNWSVLKNMTKSEIANNGTITYAYQPQWQGEWAPQSIPLPQAVRNADRVFFRFRYKPGVPTGNFVGTGNNFYLDRININQFTTSVNEVVMAEKGIILAPNPTTSGTTVMIKNGSSNEAEVRVTDITGKVLYSATASLNGNVVSSVEIPASAVAVKGIYMVQVITGNRTFAEKLIVQ